MEQVHEMHEMDKEHVDASEPQIISAQNNQPKSLQRRSTCVNNALERYGMWFPSH